MPESTVTYANDQVFKGLSYGQNASMEELLNLFDIFLSSILEYTITFELRKEQLHLLIQIKKPKNI